MTELGLVDRQEEPGVPSTVVHRLSEPSGRELLRLLNCYAPPIMGRGSDGRIDEGSWTFLSLLGEMWSSGWIECFSGESQTPTELAEATPGRTFHQVHRRLNLLVSMGLLEECGRQGRGRHYRLTDEARRGTALIAAIGRWRGRHAVPGAASGLLVQELATVVRACLPLVTLPTHANMSIRLGLAGTTDQSGGRGSVSVLARTGKKGTVRCDAEDAGAVPEAWAIGTVDTWCAAILDDKRGRMRVGGDLTLVDATLTQLYATLWD